MVPMQRPGWLTELIGIVQKLCTDTERGRSEPSEKATKIGRVHQDAERGAGWFWVGLGGLKTDSEQIEGGYLAPGEGARQRRFQLMESVQDGNVLKVKVARHAPADGLYLWIPQRAPGLLEKSLLKGLSEIDRFDLCDRFAQGRADPLPADRGARPGSGELNDEQSDAWTACCSPGVQLVWGPPGTGKTKVIALALQELIDGGESVLLVSATNIAVDNALARAAKAIRPGPGVMVRAGMPHLKEVADNPDVCLQKLVAARQEALEQRRGRLEQQIAACQHHPDLARLASVRAELEIFDLDAYRGAEGRLANARLMTDTHAELDRLRQRSGELTSAAGALRQRVERIRTTHQQAEPARQGLAKARELQLQLDVLAVEQDAANAQVLRLEGTQDRLAAELDDARTRRRFGHGHQKNLVKDNAERLATARAHQKDLAERLPGMTVRITSEIGRLRHDALPYTTETIMRLDDDLKAALEDASLAGEEQQSCARRIAQLTAKADDLRRQPEPTAPDRELVSRARAHHLPDKLAELPELERKTETVQREMAKLEEQYEQVIARMREEGLQVRRDIVRNAKVVAATLAMLRISAELRERDYDYVIVDEVAAACPPEVLYAVSRARKGVTMLGDFLQNGPIVPDAFSDNWSDPVIKRWYHQDCFAFFGIRDALSAQSNAGCVTLSKQFRFGPVITELANAVAYRGVLQMSDRKKADAPQQEVVLIDVDGLGSELAAVRPGPATGRWWPVGALLCRAIADRQVRRAEEAGAPAGATAGVVVPYKVQAELIQDVLNESGASPQIDVGTSHRFQGREFDTVIFDLVEDGGREPGWGWVAKGNLSGNSWEAGGLRMFNVGITRARRRLYLIANAAGIRQADRGPLLAIRRLIDAGKIHVVPAAGILGLPDAPAGDPIAAEIWQALQGYATLIELYDEDHLPDELCRRIDDAEKKIWLWSPWVGKRSEQLLPHLQAAQDRGVDLHAVVLPRTEVTRYLEGRHEELAAQIAGTIYLRQTHQKIIVIDGKLSFIGSMNVLAHVPGGRHEIMALFQSSTLANRILEHERIDELGSPPTCPRCHADVREVHAPAGRLTWICTASPGGHPCGWKRPFAERPRTRNQPRQRSGRPRR
jgi:hypothetical protein